MRHLTFATTCLALLATIAEADDRHPLDAPSLKTAHTARIFACDGGATPLKMGGLRLPPIALSQ